MDFGDRISLSAGEEDGAGVLLAFSKGSTWCPLTDELYLSRQEQPSGNSSHNTLFSFGLLAPLARQYTYWCEECIEPLLLQGCSCLLVDMAGTFNRSEMGWVQCCGSYQQVAVSNWLSPKLLPCTWNYRHLERSPSSRLEDRIGIVFRLERDWKEAQWKLWGDGAFIFECRKTWSCLFDSTSDYA